MDGQDVQIAAFSIGGTVIRPATGYLGPNGVVKGCPPSRDRAKQQVTLRLDPDELVKFHENGLGWHRHIDAASRWREFGSAKSMPTWTTAYATARRHCAA